MVQGVALLVAAVIIARRTCSPTSCYLLVDPRIRLGRATS